MDSVEYKVFKLKLKGGKKYLNSLFAEGKWYHNWILSHDDLKDVDTKLNTIPVKRGEAFETETLEHLSSQMKQGIYQRVWDNVKGLSARKLNGGRVGRLKFTSELNSIPLKNQTFSIVGNRIKLQNHKKRIRFVGGKQLPEEMDIRKADLVRKPSGVYLHVCLKVPSGPKPEPKGAIGLDMGIADALVFSDGTSINYSADDSKVRKLHKELSRKKKGSNNWYKARHQLRREYERVDNRKADAVNKLIHSLKGYSVVFQDEMISGWQKGWFGKQVHRSILGRLKSALQHNPDNLMLSRSLPTTQLCPECSTLNRMGLEARTYKCDCGYTQNRDVHAAKNMLIFAGQELAPVERVEDVSRALFSIQNAHLSVKQEAISL